MNKTTLTLLLILVFSTVLSQKKEYYLNDDFMYISKSEFETKLDHELGYNLKFESDTAITYVKVSRIKRGKIKMTLLDSIKTSLLNNSEQTILKDDVLLINYYPGNTPCSSKGYKDNFRKRYKQYHKKIDKMENVKQFSVYKSADDLKQFGSLIKWTPDPYKLIQNTFYPVDYPCGGYVILLSDGTYLSQRGEYCYSGFLIEKIKNLIKGK